MFHNWKFWIILFGAFIFGSLANPRIIEIEKPIEKRVEVVKEVCLKQKAWQRLKEIDDQGFLIAADGFNIVSQAFNDISELNYKNLDQYIDDLDYKAQEMSILMNEDRAGVLKTLGY